MDPRRLNPDWMTTLEDFDSAISHVARECDAVEEQVTAAKGKAARAGWYADPAWYASAQKSLRNLRRQRLVLQEKRALLARKLREEKGRRVNLENERLFVTVCRDMLSKSLYLSLWEEVERRTASEGASP